MQPSFESYNDRSMTIGSNVPGIPKAAKPNEQKMVKVMEYDMSSFIGPSPCSERDKCVAAPMPSRRNHAEGAPQARAEHAKAQTDVQPGRARQPRAPVKKASVSPDDMFARRTSGRRESHETKSRMPTC